MATYIQGVTDFIPQIQPFQPDLNFYGGLMQTKQNQYDQNWDSLNKMYGQYFYADLTRDNNIEKKDEYLKDIEFNLKRVSGLDLSLEQNITQATQVFKPFYEDKFLMKDMALTKNYITDRRAAEGLKNSSNEEMRSQYWGTGIKYMDYRMEEFKETSDEESMSFSNVTYTPYQNIMDKALKIAKDADLSVENVEFSPDGRWIIKKKNGEALEVPLQKLFEATLGADPGLQDIYRVQSVVNRKDYSYNNAAQMEGGKDAAEMEYLQKSYESLKALNDRSIKNLESQQNTTGIKVKLIEETQNKGNVTQKNTTYLENLKEAMGINAEVLSQAEVIQGQLSDGQGTLTTSSGFENPYGDLKSLRQKVDAGMASYLMQKDLGEAAHVFAFRDASVDMEANPYKVLEIRNAAAAARVNARNKGEKDNIKFKGLIESGAMVQVPTYDSNGNVTAIDYEINPNAFSTWTVKDPETGMSSDEEDKDLLAQQVTQHYKQEVNQMVTGVTDIINYMTASGSMSPDDVAAILNNTSRSTYDPVRDFKSEDSYLANREEDQTYASVNDFNKDFTDKGLYYNTDKLAGVNNRLTEFIQKNYALTEGDNILSEKLANHANKTNDYNDDIAIIDGYQNFKVKATNQIKTYLKDNKFGFTDDIFDEVGEKVSQQEFTKKLKAKGVYPEILERPVHYKDKAGNYHPVNNKNFEEESFKLGSYFMNPNTKTGGNSGTSIAKIVNKEQGFGANATATLYKADGSKVVVTGESDDPTWARNFSSKKEYVQKMVGPGGWATGSKFIVYEVTEGNRDRIQKAMGAHHIFGGVGGGLGGVRSGEKTYADYYDSLSDAINEVWTNSDVVKAKFSGVPSFTGDEGVAIFTADKEAIQVLPKGYGTPGNIYMNEAIQDINTIDWDGHGNVITNGLNPSDFKKGGDATDGDLSITEKGQILYRDFITKFKDPTSKLEPFNIQASGVAGSESLKGAMIMNLPIDFLDEYAQKTNSKGEVVAGGGMLSPEELTGFKNNGLVFISDRSNFNNGLFTNVYKDPFEIAVEYANGYDYKHPSGVGSINISPKQEGVMGSPWIATLNFQIFNPNTGKYQESQPRIVPMESLTQKSRNDMVNILSGQRQLNIQQENIYNARR
jgi:hypothetical protein